MLDENNPTKMVFIGREVDKVIKNLTVTAVYAGGAREELPRSKYTVTADKLNMKNRDRHILRLNQTQVRFGITAHMHSL